MSDTMSAKISKNTKYGKMKNESQKYGHMRMLRSTCSEKAYDAFRDQVTTMGFKSVNEWFNEQVLALAAKRAKPAPKGKQTKLSTRASKPRKSPPVAALIIAPEEEMEVAP